MPTLRTLALAAPHAIDLVWVIVTLRVAWFLPDWLGKWQRLLARRRAGA